MGTDVTAALVVLLYVWLAVLQLFDAWITHQGLSRGGRELNPLMRWAIQKAGVLPGLLIPKALVMGALLYAQPPVWRGDSHLPARYTAARARHPCHV